MFDVQESGDVKPFFAEIQLFVRSRDGDATLTAAHLTKVVAEYKRVDEGIWRLWDSFFISVATTPHSSVQHIALLEAIKAQPQRLAIKGFRDTASSQQNARCDENEVALRWQTLPKFGDQWRDVHDVLEAWRDWNGTRVGSSGSDSQSGSPGDYYLRFCSFSAALLKQASQTSVISPIWVFYAGRNVLEHEDPRSMHRRSNGISAQQLWDLDVHVTSMWFQEGSSSLWRMCETDLRLDYTDAVDEPTELWPRQDGLT